MINVLKIVKNDVFYLNKKTRNCGFLIIININIEKFWSFKGQIAGETHETCQLCLRMTGAVALHLRFLRFSAFFLSLQLCDK